MIEKFLISVLILVGMLLMKTQPTAAMGLGEWGHGTKNKTYIYGDGGVQIENRRTRIYHVKKWYYYQDHIVGITYIPSNDDYYSKSEEAFFILDEISGKIENFESIEKWRETIKSDGLKPKIITRWYKDHFPAWFIIVIYSFCFPIISIPMYLCLFYLLFKFLKEVFFQERFNVKEPFTQIFIFLSLIIGVCLFLSNNYQSF